MSTRGVFGFRIDGVDKLIYNQSDSYPDGLGQDIVNFLSKYKGNFIKLIEKVRKLQPVGQEGSGNPTSEQIAVCAKHGVTNCDVDVRNADGTPSWYQLLRGAQGDLVKTLKVGMYEDSTYFLADSLFCEWAYVINLDEQVFEVYEGYQKQPHEKGRYANMELDRERQVQYYPVALVRTFPLSKLPKDLENALHPTPVEELAGAHE